MLILVSLGAASLLLSTLNRNSGQNRYEIQTMRQMEQAKVALIGYAQLHGHLPSPAASAIEGKAAPQLCIPGKGCNGFLPWLTLGVSGADGWGKMLRYSVTEELTRAPILRLHAVATRRILGRDSTGALRLINGNTTCTLTTQCLAAVIFSSGKNNFGTSSQGIPLANGTIDNIDEASNEVAANDFIFRQKTDATAIMGGEFDDLVLGLKLSELYLQMNKTSQLP